MEQRRKTIATLAVTGLIFLSCIAFISLRFVEWNRTGWAGMFFEVFEMPKEVKPKENEPDPTALFLDRLVIYVFSGGPADAAGIRVGDKVLEINGINAKDKKPIEELIAGLKVGDTVVYKIKRGEKDFSVSLSMESPFKSKLIALSLITGMLLALCVIAIGLFVYLKKPEDRRAHIFYLLSVFGSLAVNWQLVQLEMVSGLGIFRIFPIIDLFSNKITYFLIFFCIVAYLFILFALHLTLVFPKERPAVKNHPYIFRWIYGTTILPMIWFTLFFFTFRRIFELKPSVEYTVELVLLGLAIFLFSRCSKEIASKGWKKGLISQPFTIMAFYTSSTIAILKCISLLGRMIHLPSIIETVRFILYILFVLPVIFSSFLSLICPVIAIVALMLSYRESDIEEKKQIKWPLWGTAALMLIMIFSNIISLVSLAIIAVRSDHWGFIVLQAYSSISSILLKLVFLAIPISFAFAILKYRLMDIDVVVKKTFIYTLVTGIIVAFYFALTGGLGLLLVSYAGVQSQWITVFSTIAVVLVFNPVKSRVQGFADKRFFRMKYDYPQALRILNRQILEAPDLRTMLKHIAEHVQQTLQNRSVALFVREADGRSFTAMAKIGFPDEVFEQLKFEAGGSLIKMMNSPFDARGKDLPDDEKSKLRRSYAELIVPAKLKNEPIGFISLGGKLSDKEYDAEDMEFLTAAADQLAVAIDDWRLREQEEGFIQQEKVLVELIDKINKLDSISEISKLVATELESTFHFEGFWIFYQEEHKRDLALVHSSGRRLQNDRIAEDRALFRCIEDKEKAFDFLLSDELPPDEKEWLSLIGVKLIVPVMSSERRLIGLLLLGGKSDGESFKTNEVKLLEAVANQMAGAYENMVLKERVDKDRKIKREVLARFEEQNINLVKECPSCGLCYDGSSERCDKDNSELTLSLPVERTVEGKYRLERLLGKGGMGAVYEAVDLRLSRSVAVKIMLGHSFGDKEALRRFEREARASARLSHPNIITVYDYGRLAAEGAYLVMEFVKGETLRSMFNRFGHLKAEIVAEWLDQLLEGMKAAHRAGVIHRDLKPENVFITESESGRAVVKILDFGLAKVRRLDTADPSSLTAPGTIMGTFGYMPLEQLTADEADERSDIFSIGVMAAEALTGQRPFSGKTMAELVRSMSKEDFLFEGDSEEIKRLNEALRKCLAKDRSDRFASADEMQKELIPAIRNCPLFAASDGSYDDNIPTVKWSE